MDNPGNRSGHSITSIHDRQILFGGLVPGADRKEHSSNEVFILNNSDLRWKRAEARGPQPHGVFAHTATIVGRGEDIGLAVFGGMMNGGTLTNQLCFLSLKNLSHTTWSVPKTSSEGTRPCPRWGHTAIRVQVSGELFMFGGMCSNGALNDTWLWSPSTKGWKQCECSGDVPPPRRRHTAVLSGHKMIIFGGRDASGKHFNDLHELDLVSLTWSKTNVKMGLKPSSRVGHTCIVQDNRLIVYGGSSVQPSAESGYVVNNDAYAIDLSKTEKEWIKLPQQDSPERTMAAGFCIGSTAYVHGGRDCVSSNSTLFTLSIPPPRRVKSSGLGLSIRHANKKNETTSLKQASDQRAPDSPFSSFVKNRMTEVRKPLAAFSLDNNSIMF